MLTEIRLKNFRGFENHLVRFNPTTVIVGQNNAGKTTVVEALRLISIVVQKFKNSNYHYPPDMSEISRRNLGIYPSSKNLEINFKSIHFQYNNDQPAIIEALFDNRASLIIYLYSDETIFAQIKNTHGKYIINKSQASSLDIPEISIMPQVAPLQRSEKILTDDYVRNSMSSRLAPLHFRNQLKLRYDLFSKFKSTVEETWPNVRIESLIGRNRNLGEELHLEVRNEGFVAEIAEMGHGLQMWLQTIWFLTLSEKSKTVILDEPDVYMHADLQRRIVRHLKSKYSQMILTTHSVEIMSEVQPDELLIINKKSPESNFANTLPSVQEAISRSGSVHNIHLARLLSANKILLVEGKDLKIFKEFQDTLFPNSPAPLQGIPNMDIGGWGGWKLAVGTSLGFKNALGQSIATYCILDSDFHTDEEKNERLVEAKSRNIQLHIWKKKEIENYLLIPEVISRLISMKIAKRVPAPNSIEILNKIIQIADELEPEIHDAIANDYLSRNKGGGLPSANKHSRGKISEHRKLQNNIIDMASGKILLSSLSQWTKEEFGVSFSAQNVAREIRPIEFPDEVRMVMNAIEFGNSFNF